MQCNEVIEKYINGLKEGFKCIDSEKRLRIITPYIYPDNDFIEIFVEELANGFIKITDLGESYRHLHTQGFDISISPKRKFLAETIASRVNVEISGGKLFKICLTNDIFNSMHDIISACRGIADLIYTSKAYEPESFFDEVREFLDDNQFKYESKIKFQGASNKQYTIDFEIIDKQILLMQALSPKDTYSIKPKVDATVRMWYDINQEKRKISLLNDVDFRWGSPDLYILNKISTVLLWSKKEDFTNIIYEQY